MLALAAGSVQAQSRVTITDLGPGSAGRILRDAISRPHTLITPADTAFTQRRGELQQGTLIVLGRTTYIGGKVEGDVIVVNADLFVRPGAEITGRAIAIGGGAYASTLAYVGAGTQSFRDDGFTVQTVGDGYQLAYRSLREGSTPPLFLPGVYGLRIPTYDRVNGLSLPYGPAVSFLQGRGELNALATYRSDLGKVDPSVTAELRLNRRVRLEASASRGSFTNERWIYPDLINSAASLIFGEDTRNWYRANRGELSVHRKWEFPRLILEPFIGARVEATDAVGPTPGDLSGPWSLFGRDDTLGMLRPNPQVSADLFASGLAGFALAFEDEEGMRLRAHTVLESGMAPSSTVVPEPNWLQAITDFDLRFPTFGDQQYAVEVRWVTTGGNFPLERFHYLGGPGTMPFLEMLQQGGGELLLVDQRYSIPFLQYNFGFMGSPTLQLRHRLGSAGLNGLPALEQMVGVGVSLTVIRGEVRLDPASGKVQLAAGFTFTR
jgi:hypothetical protein